MIGLYGLAWFFSFLTIFFPGFLLARLFFKQQNLSWAEIFAISLMLGSTLIIIPQVFLGVLVKGGLPIYCRIVLPTMWVGILVIYLLKRPDDLYDMKSFSKEFGMLMKTALIPTSLTKTLFIGLFSVFLLYAFIFLFVFAWVGWDAYVYHIPQTRLIFNEGYIPLADPFLNLGQPISSAPFTKLIYSFIFYSFNTADHQLLSALPIIYGIGTMAVGYASAKRAYGEKIALLSILILLYIPIFPKLHSSYAHYADVYALFFYACVIHFFVLSMEWKNRGLAIVVGVTLSLALLTKFYNATSLPLSLLITFFTLAFVGQKRILCFSTLLALSPLFMLAILVDTELAITLVVSLVSLIIIGIGYVVSGPVTNTSRRGLIKFVSIAFLFSALGAIWYVRNWFSLNNPVYPYLPQLFPQNPWKDPNVLNVTRDIYATLTKPVDGLAHLNSLWHTIPIIFLSFNYGLFLCLFKIVGISIALQSRKKWDFILLSWLSIHYITWLLLFKHNDRYLTPLLIPLAILAARGLSAVCKRFEDFVSSLVGISDRSSLIFVGTTFFTLLGSHMLYYAEETNSVRQLAFISEPIYKLHFTRLSIQTTLALSLFPLMFLFPSIGVVAIRLLLKKHQIRIKIKSVDLAKMKPILFAVLIISGLYVMSSETFTFFSEGTYTSSAFQQWSNLNVFDGLSNISSYLSNTTTMEDVILSCYPPLHRFHIDRKFVEVFTGYGIWVLNGIRIKNTTLFAANTTEEVLAILKAYNITYLVIPLKDNWYYEWCTYFAQKSFLFKMVLEDRHHFPVVFSYRDLHAVCRIAYSY